MIYTIYASLPNSDKIYQYPIDLTDEGLADLKKIRKILISAGQIKEVAQLVKICKGDKGEANNEDTKIIRVIGRTDLIELEKIKQEAQEYLPICEEKIKKYGLVMKLFDADLSFDRKKLTFYFGAENRVDFRELVSDLIKSCKKIIRLQQIGSRDQTKISGGYGCCGQELCCKRFLKKTSGVTLEPAKIQDLSGSVGKISGLCGKLMCCLEYEVEEYIRVKKKLPKIGTKLKTKCGKAVVVSHNVVKESVLVEVEGDKRRLEVKI